MTRQRGWILLALGLFLAVGTGTGLYLLLQRQQRTLNERAAAMAEAASTPMLTMSVPVAARPLSPGTVLTPEDVLVKEFPLELVPPSAITTELILENQLIIEPVAQGETFTPAKLAGESAEQMSLRLEPGQMLFAFPITDLLSQANIVADGDRIDLLLTLDVSGAEGVAPGSLTMFTIQNIDVLKVLKPAESSDNPESIALLLAVTPEEAVIIKHVKDSGGVIDFMLRSLSDREEFVVPSVDRDDLIARYGVQ